MDNRRSRAPPRTSWHPPTALVPHRLGPPHQLLDHHKIVDQRLTSMHLHQVKQTELGVAVAFRLSKMPRVAFQLAGSDEKTTLDVPTMLTTTHAPPHGLVRPQGSVKASSALESRRICNRNAKDIRIECCLKIVLAPIHPTCKKVAAPRRRKQTHCK